MRRKCVFIFHFIFCGIERFLKNQVLRCMLERHNAAIGTDWTWFFGILIVSQVKKCNQREKWVKYAYAQKSTLLFLKSCLFWNSPRKKILHICIFWFRKVLEKEGKFHKLFVSNIRKKKNKGNIKGLLNICILMYTVYKYTFFRLRTWTVWKVFFYESSDIKEIFYNISIFSVKNYIMLTD